MITYFSSQGRPGLTQQGSSAGRDQVHHDLFQGQRQQELQGDVHQQDSGQEQEGMDEVQIIERSGTPNGGVEANPVPENVPPVQQAEQPYHQPVQLLQNEQEVHGQPHDAIHDQQKEEHDGLSLVDRVRPEVPPAEVAGPANTGWESVRRLGGWQAFLVEFPMLEEVPEQPEKMERSSL